MDSFFIVMIAFFAIIGISGLFCFFWLISDLIESYKQKKNQKK